MSRFLQDLLTRHRGWILLIAVLPASFVVERAQWLRSVLGRWLPGREARHDRAVEKIRQRVRTAAAEGKRMCTARPPWQSMSIRRATFKKDLARIPLNLRTILALDRARNVVRLEPMATIGEVTQYLVPRGFALAVQPEMDDLTVGGLCFGVGIETSSHRHGFLSETVEAYEVVLGDGRLVRVTRTEEAALYHALPWSHGTLGFLVAVELKVVPVTRHIRLRYLPFRTRTGFCERLVELAEAADPPSYLEGLAYPGSGGVVLCGEPEDPATPEQRGRRFRLGRWYQPWFHDHVEEVLQAGWEREEFLPTRAYFHRHTPSVFFQLPDLIPMAGRAWYRWLFGWLGAPRISLMKAFLTRELRRESMEKRVAQDLLIPVGDLEEGIKMAEREFGVSPLWICPVRMVDRGEREGFLRNPVAREAGGAGSMYVDLGIYGIPGPVREGAAWDAVEAGRRLEAWTRRKAGYHLLYADIFMTREEFEAMYEHRNYRKARQQYGAEEAFPEVYDKVVREEWLREEEGAG